MINELREKDDRLVDSAVAHSNDETYFRNGTNAFIGEQLQILEHWAANTNYAITASNRSQLNVDTESTDTPHSQEGESDDDPDSFMSDVSFDLSSYNSPNPDLEFPNQTEKPFTPLPLPIPLTLNLDQNLPDPLVILTDHLEDQPNPVVSPPFQMRVVLNVKKQARIIDANDQTQIQQELDNPKAENEPDPKTNHNKHVPVDKEMVDLLKAYNPRGNMDSILLTTCPQFTYLNQNPLNVAVVKPAAMLLQSLLQQTKTRIRPSQQGS